MIVLKFGGSSLADAEHIRAAARIVMSRYEQGRTAVVLSAMKGVTNLLDEAATAAEAGEHSYSGIIERLRDNHFKTIEALSLPEEELQPRKGAEQLFGELQDVLHGVELVKECSPRIKDFILSFGERLSCTIMASLLAGDGTSARVVDTRGVVITDAAFGGAAVDFPESYQRIVHAVEQEEAIPIITGFIASTTDGITTTLGRNGSDYTASIVGAALNAEEIEIWTDVDGVYSADPRAVENAFVIPRISVQEAMELSYFGAEVIHPYTMVPAVEHEIPLRIKNSSNPEAPGTEIVHHRVQNERMITGIASIPNVALINVEGGGMVGIPGMASRVFRALGSAGVNIIMISQASSEHSICIVCRDAHAKAALASLKAELASELDQKKIEEFQLITDLEIVAIIGENMRGRPGISGRLFSSLGDGGVNVLAIAQGSSEMNISFVIRREDQARALRVVHQAFFPEQEGAGPTEGASPEEAAGPTDGAGRKEV